MVRLLGFRNAVDQFSDHKLVCIDEFELDDPGDTVIMSTFLNELVNRGVNVAVTSNTLPDRLGAERFAADNFLREYSKCGARQLAGTHGSSIQGPPSPVRPNGREPDVTGFARCAIGAQ